MVVNPYMNEEANWQRLKDIQQEIEFSHLMASQGLPAALRLARLLAARAWWIAGLAARRAPRRRPGAVRLVERDEADVASDVASDVA
jgi:hypothetical protein